MIDDRLVRLEIVGVERAGNHFKHGTDTFFETDMDTAIKEGEKDDNQQYGHKKEELIEIEIWEISHLLAK